MTWDLKEIIRWCWNGSQYKGDLVSAIDDKKAFLDLLEKDIESVNSQLSNDLQIDPLKVDGDAVYRKFRELLGIDEEDEDSLHVEFLSDYTDEEIRQIEMKNTAYYRNNDCIECGLCFEHNEDVCSWDDSQIVSVEVKKYE